MQYWDKKSNATIFDVEIDGVRTMICRRAGKFKNAEQTRGLLREGGRFATIWTARMMELKEVDLAKADVKGTN